MLLTCFKKYILKIIVYFINLYYDYLLKQSKMFHENIYFFIFKNGQLFFYFVLLNVFTVEGIENAKKFSFFYLTKSILLIVINVIEVSNIIILCVRPFNI